MNVTSVLFADHTTQQTILDKTKESHQTGNDYLDGSDKFDSKSANNAVAIVNKKLESATTQITFSYDTKSNRIWLNVVDKSTGKVISEIPPESIRKIVDSYSTAGLNVDKFR